MTPRSYSLASLVTAVVAIVILVIPFVGVFTLAVLGPLSIGLGAVGVSRTKDGGPSRKIALGGLTLGLVALLILVIFLASGAYSDYAR